MDNEETILFDDGAETPILDPWADLAAQNAEHAKTTGSAWDYTIIERAKELAEANGTEQEVEEGRLLARYSKRIGNVTRQYKVIYTMYADKLADLRNALEDLQAEIRSVEYEQAQLPRIVAELTQRDAMMVRDYMATAPQFQDAKRKSWGTPFGKLSRRTQTRKETFLKGEIECVDDLLANAFDGTALVRIERKPVWDEIKKRLAMHNGQIIDAETGIVLPEGAVIHRAEQSDEHYYVEVDGYKIDLTEASISGNTGSSDGAEQADHGDTGDAAEDDFFGPGGEYGGDG